MNLLEIKLTQTEVLENFYFDCDTQSIYSVKKKKLLNWQKDKDGYFYIVLWINNKAKLYRRNRIAYCIYKDISLEDIQGYHIHHKNEIKSDDTLDNLELIKPFEHASEHKKGNKNRLGSKNTQEQNKKLSEFRTGKPLSEETKLKISQSLKGKPKSETTKSKMGIKHKIKIVQLSLNDEIIKIWDSATDSEKESSWYFNHSSIIATCKGKRNKHKGFKWKYYGI